MLDISVIAGPASLQLAERIAKHLHAELIVPELKVFSDGESKVRIERTAPKCVIVQSTYPPVDTHLMQAMMMAKRCRDGGAQDICAAIPYLAYARQDRAFLEGESISSSLVARLLGASGFTSMITVDIHSQLAASHFSFMNMQSVSSIPLLAEHAKTMRLQNPIAVSPDAGGVDRVRNFAEHLESDMLAFKKSRNRDTGEVSVDATQKIDLSGRDAILVDDMISSGGSIIKAAEALLQNGANRVFAMCAHALMLGDSAQRIKAAGIREVIATNSIPNEYAKVDLSPAIGSALLAHFGP